MKISRRSLLGTFIGVVAGWPFAAVYKPKHAFNLFAYTDCVDIIYSPPVNFEITHIQQYDHIFDCIKAKTCLISDSYLDYNITHIGLCTNDNFIIGSQRVDVNLHKGDALNMTYCLKIPNKMNLDKLDHTNRGFDCIDNIKNGSLTKEMYEALAPKVLPYVKESQEFYS